MIGSLLWYCVRHQHCFDENRLQMGLQCLYGAHLGLGVLPGLPPMTFPDCKTCKSDGRLSSPLAFLCLNRVCAYNGIVRPGLPPLQWCIWRCILHGHSVGFCMTSSTRTIDALIENLAGSVAGLTHCPVCHTLSSG